VCEQQKEIRLDCESEGNMDKVLKVADLRPILQVMYAEVEDERDDNENYEHPMTAVGLVLLSAVIMGTTDATKLALFTCYSRYFISAITLNMDNNQLWVDGVYDASTWLSSDGTIDDKCFWDHIEVACGSQFMPAGDTNIKADPCKIYWGERGFPGRKSK
jgi:hypothetical protein